MIIQNEKVAGLKESAKAIGLSYGTPLSDDRGVNVMLRLASMPLNSGEANVLTGVNVQFSIVASIKWWQQAQRYHWFQGEPIPPKIKRGLVYSVPVGMLEEARVTTNYLQLMTMYTQRIHHQLDEWRYFCAWMYKRLPYFKELVEARKCDVPDTQLLSLIPVACPDVLG